MNQQVNLKWFQHYNWELELITDYISKNINTELFTHYDVYPINTSYKDCGFTAYFQYQIFCESSNGMVDDIVNVTIIRNFDNGKWVYKIKKSRNQPKVKSFVKI